MMLVKAGAPVEATIDLLMPLLEKDDIIIDGGNEWYENTEHRQKKVAEKGLMYLGMGVSGGEEGARNGKRQSVMLHLQRRLRCDNRIGHPVTCLAHRLSDHLRLTTMYYLVSCLLDSVRVS